MSYIGKDSCLIFFKYCLWYYYIYCCPRYLVIYPDLKGSSWFGVVYKDISPHTNALKVDLKRCLVSGGGLTMDLKVYSLQLSQLQLNLFLSWFYTKIPFHPTQPTQRKALFKGDIWPSNICSVIICPGDIFWWYFVHLNEH